MSMIFYERISNNLGIFCFRFDPLGLIDERTLLITQDLHTTQIEFNRNVRKCLIIFIASLFDMCSVSSMCKFLIYQLNNLP